MSTELILSTFQRDKFHHFFKFCEPNQEGILESRSSDWILKRIMQFTGWSAESPKAREFKEVNALFFDVLFDMAAEDGDNKGQATLSDWFNFWARILQGHKGMSHFPVWLRLMPKVLFNIIDKNGDGLITEDELLNFYKYVVRVCDLQLEENCRDAFKEMTDEGRYPLHMDSYEQIFANFLFGKTPYGPGKYIFGCFEHNNAHFELIKPAAQDGEGYMEIKVVQDKRPKKFKFV